MLPPQKYQIFIIITHGHDTAVPASSASSFWFLLHVLQPEAFFLIATTNRRSRTSRFLG
jgi:hypothetical protein